MAAGWTFNLIDFPPLPNQQTSEASSRSLVAVTAASQPQNPRALSPPRRISVGYPTATYGQLHFLNLPGEVRLTVWRAIHYDILLGSEEFWFDHPSTAWDGLQLSCRQIHTEIADYWPCAILPQAKVDTAFTQVLSIELLTNFRRLSLELSFSKGQNFYESLALALGTLAPVLEDLRLFFIGKDKFKVKSFVHGCGLRDSTKKTSNTRLLIDGQYQPERKDIFMVLYFMQRLRTLVISNPNYPLLQSLIIKNKPHLEYLHISTDPRSCLYTKLDLGNHHQLIVPPEDNYPPVKKLHISTNAALTALQVAAKVARTVEELNWTVTDIALQHYIWPWLEQTTALLDHLGNYAVKLRTLRMCFHAPIYEAHYSEATVIGGLKQHLPRLTSLECLEIHMYSKADFSGAEILFAIPDSVKRLYISDKLISAKKLEELITKRYLWSESMSHKSPHKTRQILCIDDNFGSASIAVSQTTLVIPAPDRDYSRKDNGTALDPVGETRRRTDHIPFRHGNLGFVGYEHEAHEDFCECKKCDMAKLIMLRLNGRLLDRERNSHLAVFYHDGSQIWPKINPDAYPSMDANWRENLGEDLTQELERLNEITEEWDADLNNYHSGYFGMEDEALGLFIKEVGVTGEELPERKWPEDVAVGAKEHWLSEA